MDFYQCFKCMISGENLDQVHEQILQLKEEDPVQFIHNLLEIITSDQYPDNDRINALKFLTFPLRSNNTKYKSQDFLNFKTVEIPEEVIDEVLEVLFSYLTYPQEVSSVASSVFIFYCQNQNYNHMNSVLVKIIEAAQSNESLTPELLKIYLRIMKGISQTYWRISIPEYRQFFVTNLEGKEQCEDDELVSLLLTMLNKTMSITYNQEANEEISLYLTIGLTFADRFPNECYGLIYGCICRDFEQSFPEFPDALFQILSAGPQYSCFFQLIPPFSESFGWYVGDHLDDIIALALSYIGEAANAEIDSEDDKPPFANRANYFLEGCVQSRTLDLFPSFRAYVAEHLGEDGTTTKYAAAVLNMMLLRRSRADRDQLVYDIDQSDVLESLLSDSNQVIYREGLTLIVALVENEICDSELGLNALDSQSEPSTTVSRESSQTIQRFEVGDEILQIAFENYSSPSDSLRDLADSILQTVVSCRNEAVNEKIFTTLLEVVQDTEQTEEAILQALNTLKDTVFALTAEQASDLLPEIYQTTAELLEKDPSSILLSAYVGVLGTLFNKCASQLDESVQSSLSEFVTQLFQDDKEDDSAYLLSLLIKRCGLQNEEIMQMGKDLVTNRLSDANNETNLISLNDVCQEIIKVQPEADFEFEHFVIDTTIAYIMRPEISRTTKSKIMDTYNLINSHFPELIAEKAIILFDFLSGFLVFGCCSNTIANIVLTVLSNLSKEDIGVSKQLKELIQSSVSAFTGQLSYRYFSVNANSEEELFNKKLRCAQNIYELLCIAEAFDLAGEIKIWSNQYELVRELIPEENMEHFLALQPPPEQN